MSRIRANQITNQAADGAPTVQNGLVISGVTTSTSFSGSGASLTNLPAAQLSGTAAAINGSNITNLNASNIASGTVPTARLGSGTANSSTFLAGDSTFKTVTGTTINNNADNRVITGSGTANTLEAESTLTYNGTNLTISNGNLVIGTAGKGIDFGATANSTATGVSMSHETLDDYEEGNWTPFFYAWIGGGVPATHDIQFGKYTKIGRMVHIVFDLKGDRGNMGGNYITVGGLPFAHLGSNAEFSSIPWTEYVGGENSTSSTRGHGLEFGGGATVHAWLTGYTSGAGGSGYTATYMSTSYMSNTNHTRIRGSATYLTDA